MPLLPRSIGGHRPTSGEDGVPHLDHACGNRHDGASSAIGEERPMKCYELQGPGGIDELALVDKPTPQPGRGELLVRLTAASLNYRDLLTVKGGYGSRQKFPLVPCSDGAGVIEAIGEGVRGFATGDRVIGSFFEGWLGGEPSEAKMRTALGGSVDGTLTEYRLFPANAVVKTPAHLTDVE